MITKKDNETFSNSTKCWICDNDYIDNDVKVRNPCHITGRYRGSVHRDCKFNLKLNHKILVDFHNLKNYDYHLIMQELGKSDLKINFITNGLEKYMSFTISNMSIFIDSFQCLSSSLDSTVKNIGKDDCQCLSQDLYNNTLDLFKQKGFYPYE